MLNPIIMGMVYKVGATLEAWELRVLVETGIVELAIQKATAEDLRELRRANARIKEAADGKGVDSVLLRDLDLEFHRVLLKATKNGLVMDLGHALYQLFFASIEKSVAADPIRAYRNHRLIVQAIESRHAGKARSLVVESLSHWVKILKADESGRGKEEAGGPDRKGRRAPASAGGRPSGTMRGRR